MSARSETTQQLIAALQTGNKELRAVIEALDADIDALYTEDDVTAGTVSASSVVKVDASSNIAGFNNITGINSLTTAGNTVQIDAGTGAVTSLIGKFVSTQPASAASKGTANTGVVAAEYGDDRIHRTALIVSQAAAVTLADDAALADGYKIYTFPAGKLAIFSAVIDGVTLTNAEHNGESYDLGLGTTIAAGGVATLDGTPAFENVMTGQTAAVGTGESAAVNTPLFIAAADSHELYINVAATWANTAGAALDGDLAGTVWIEWAILS